MSQEENKAIDAKVNRVVKRALLWIGILFICIVVIWVIAMAIFWLVLRHP